MTTSEKDKDLARIASTRATRKPGATAGSVEPVAHSPLPWRLDNSWHGFIDAHNGSVVWDKHITVSNAEFIVKAVNVHDELIAALQAAHHFIANGIELGFIRMPDPDGGDPALRVPGLVRAALAKAGH